MFIKIIELCVKITRQVNATQSFHITIGVININMKNEIGKTMEEDFEFIDLMLLGIESSRQFSNKEDVTSIRNFSEQHSG